MTFERGVYLGRDSHGDITGRREISITRKPLVSEVRLDRNATSYWRLG